jgi:hypothetical protein
MGMAKAAELNGYPGPRHVLDLSPELHLTDAQTKLVRGIPRADECCGETPRGRADRARTCAR